MGLLVVGEAEQAQEGPGQLVDGGCVDLVRLTQELAQLSQQPAGDGAERHLGVRDADRPTACPV